MNHERAAIARIVDSFYAKAREDEILGPIFESQVKDWPKHLERITSFWASALLREGSYSGQPMRVHLAIPGIKPEMFDIWLALFEKSVHEELGDAELAQRMIDTAHRVGTHMARNVGNPPTLLLGDGLRRTL